MKGGVGRGGWLNKIVGLEVMRKDSPLAVAEPEGGNTVLGSDSEREGSRVRKLVRNWRPGWWSSLTICYERGPTRVGVYGKLTKMGAGARVVVWLAPTLVPVKAGDRVKTGPFGMR